MGNPNSNVIAFVQPFVPTYRKGLFDAIDERLRANGYELEVWHDQPKGIVAARRNSSSGEWSVPTKQHRLSFRRRNITYRNIWRRSRSVRAVVAGLASTNLETYLLAADPKITLMLWGHGRNFTAGNNPLDARLEKWLCDRATHVFTYTNDGASHLTEHGVSKEKLSTVLNSTDTGRLRRSQAEASTEYLESLTNQLNVRNSEVALFVGAFDEPKRLPFLFDAADRVHAARPNFVLLLAGAGPLDDYVAECAKSRPYVRLVGRLEIDELARLSNLVDILVMPGRVGLVAIDSLALGIPLATTSFPFHAPEAQYLSHQNSIWTEDSVDEYAAGLIAILANQTELQSLKLAARTAGDEFSVEKSAQIFVDGLLLGLAE